MERSNRRTKSTWPACSALSHRSRHTLPIDFASQRNADMARGLDEKDHPSGFPSPIRLLHREPRPGVLGGSGIGSLGEDEPGAIGGPVPGVTGRLLGGASGRVSPRTWI